MRLLTFIALALGIPAIGAAQVQGGSASGTPDPAAQPDGTLRIRLPVLTVTAQKEPEDAQKAPVSVTPVPAETLESAAIRSVSDAADFAPNTFFNEFTARKLSNPRFRAIGSSPANPGITTYIDGVPQLHANSSSIELLDVSQIEFVRGPQSALFGRNTIGGLINVSTLRPSLARWSGRLAGPFGNFGSADVRFTASGPVAGGRVGVGIAAGYSTREGFTKNDVSGNDLDSRSAAFAKTQLLWTPSTNWETRFIFSGERARDGDYALNDLGALRANPFHVSRDFEGHTHRDIVAPTVIVRRTSGTVDITSTTGVVWWETDDETDLDYSGLPLATRINREKDVQFTEEVRVASARDASIALSGDVSLRWQAGLSIFTQSFDQNAVNSYAPFVLDPRLAFPVR
jgi:iron complex outermembrane receptor protein